MALNSQFGSLLAQKTRLLRQLLGRNTVVYPAVGGTAYQVSQRIIPSGEGKLFLQGIGRNAANPDLREISWSPADFVSASAYPAEQQEIAITEGGTTYTFEIVKRHVIQGVDNSDDTAVEVDQDIRTFVFREQQDNSFMLQASDEPEPGESVNLAIWPPANPQNE